MNVEQNNDALETPQIASSEKILSVQDEALWTTQQVAQYLHISLKSVFNLRKNGLPYVQLGGAVRFMPQEIKDYLVNRRGLSMHRLRHIVRKESVV